MSKIPGMLHKLGSMSQELTDNPPGIWGLGCLFVLHSINMSPRWG